MKIGRIFVLGLGISAVLVALSYWSRTVEWEEEVPLNIGQTIWVKRMVKYTPQGDSGNPLKIAYGPQEITHLEFEWGNRKYRYRGDACLRVLAINSLDRPVLIAGAGCHGWASIHRYNSCNGYVQLNPSDNGSNWTWPPNIEEWVYDLRTNLVSDFSYPDRLKKRLSKDTRESLLGADPQTESLRRIVRPATSGSRDPQCN